VSDLHARRIAFVSVLCLTASLSWAVAIPGDFNGNGTVGLDDLGYFVKQFSSCKAGGSWDSAVILPQKTDPDRYLVEHRLSCSPRLVRL
jgi:hypothetical protein